MRYEDIRHDLIEAVLRHVEKHEDPRDDLVDLVLRDAPVRKLMMRASTPEEWADIGAIAFLVHNVAPGIAWGERLRDDWRKNPDLCGICKAGRSHVSASYGGIPPALLAFVSDFKPADPDVVEGLAGQRERLTEGPGFKFPPLQIRGGLPYAPSDTIQTIVVTNAEPGEVLDFDDLTPGSEVVRQHVEAQLSTATGIPKDEAKFIGESGSAS